MIVLARDIEKAWFSEWEDINKYLGKIENIGADLFIQKNQWDTYEDLVDKYENLRERYHKLWWLWEPSAYKKLDEYHKWVIPWTVQTIVAYSNVWKSSFAYSLIVDLLKRGKKVTIFSNEVTSDMLFSLLIKYYYNSSFDSVMRPEYVFEPSDFRNLVIYDNVINLQEIDMLTKHSDADSVFIDFIQNVECEWKWEYEVMTKVAKGIQRLAIATNKTIFSISQANNESRFASWDKIQPKWSWAIFASSDVILALSTTARNDTLNLNILKNKFGKKDINFALDVDFDKWKFQISRQIDELEDQPKA